VSSIAELGASGKAAEGCKPDIGSGVLELGASRREMIYLSLGIALGAMAAHIPCPWERVVRDVGNISLH